MSSDSKTRDALRARLIALLERSCPELPNEIRDDTPILDGALLDSVGLVELAAWIESEVGSALDLTRFNIPVEWATIGAIVAFVKKQREGIG